MLNTTPLISICCITYNHAPYIRQCLDGFFMQQCNFDFEVLIHDDASTDGTQEIIKEYQQKYPKTIKPIFQTENQWSKGIRTPNPRYNFPRAKGKYIALCEGDDYWTDSLKLQKQVDFLENNPEYSLTVGGFKKNNVYTGKTENIIKIVPEVEKNENGYTFELEDTRKGWITKTLTAVFKNKKELEILSTYKYGRDINSFYHILKTGKGFYFTEILGVYNIHEGGVNSMKQGVTNKNAAYNTYKEIYLLNKEEHTRINHFFHTISLLNFNLYTKYKGNTIKSRLFLIKEAVLLISNIKELKHFIFAFISPNFKIKNKRKK